MTDKLIDAAQHALDSPHGRKEENNGRPDQIRSGVHGRLPLGIRSDHVLGNRAFSSMMTDALWGSNEVMAINAELGLTMDQLARLANAILNAAPTPPAQRVMLTQKMVLDAARELCRIHAGECQVDEQDTWDMYSAQFKRDARAALEAAFDAAPTPPAQEKQS